MEDEVLSRPHPYLPNSVPDIKEKMIEEIGVRSIDDLYVELPEKLRFKGELDLPGPFTEQDVCELVDMAVANASMYDWATALGEAALLSNRLNHRNTILVPYHISPARLAG